MKETITLHLGSFGCHVGAHYWNFQKELLNAQEDMDNCENFDAERLYRAVGKGTNRHLTPRVLVTDLRENLGYMMFENDRESISGYRLRDDERNEDVSGIWGGSVSRLQRADIPALHPFQNFLKNTSSESYYASLSSSYSNEKRVLTQIQRPPENTIRKWTDYVDTAVPENSLYNMPMWCTSSSFDMFASGLPCSIAASAGIDDSFVEGYMDRVRILAEECDNLRNIQLFADAFDGFGALTATIVQELRQEYRGVTLPVFAFTKRTNSAHVATSAASQQLQSLSIPYVYSQLYEHATVTIPIYCPTGLGRHGDHLQLNSKSDYHSAALVAAAIEGLLGNSYLRQSHEATQAAVLADEGNESDMYNMIFRATVAGRLPLCHLETAFPLSLYPDAEQAHESFLAAAGRGRRNIGEKRGEGITAEDQRAEDSVVSNTETTGAFNAALRGTLNPFMMSLSAATHNQSQNQPSNAALQKACEEETSQRFVRLSNVVTVRGPSHDNFGHLLFARSAPSQYLVNTCVQRQTELYLSKSFPHFFVGTNEFGLTESLASASVTAELGQAGRGCLSVSVLSAIGADSDLGCYLNRMATSWKQSYSSSAVHAQLSKTGFGADDFAEVAECLHTMANCYFE